MFHLHASRRWIQACSSIFTRPVMIQASEPCGKAKKSVRTPKTGMLPLHHVISGKKKKKKNHSSEPFFAKDNIYVLPVSDDDEMNWGLLCWKSTLRTFILQIFQGLERVAGKKMDTFICLKVFVQPRQYKSLSHPSLLVWDTIVISVKYNIDYYQIQKIPCVTQVQKHENPAD